MDTSPIFLLSCERSGSTLLRYILDTHPAICSPGEILLGATLDALYRTLSRTTALVLGDCHDPEACKEHTRTELRRVTHDLLGRYCAARGKAMWCDKSPGNLDYLDLIDWVFPEARYICLYRNGLDVVRSSLEACRHGFVHEYLAYGLRYPQNFTAAMVASWVEKTRKLLEFEARHPRAVRIHYEAIVRAPERSLGRMFEFLGLELPGDLLARVFVQPHDQGGGDWKIRTTTRLDPSRIGGGGALEPIELARVPAALRSELADLHLELGYPI